LDEDADAVCCIVIEYLSIGADDCFSIPDCLGNVVGGEVIVEVVESEHLLFHCSIFVYFGWWCGVATCFVAVGDEESLFKVAGDGCKSLLL
jgi:hypothetical protein